MFRPYPNPAATALLRVLGPYLAHGIDVYLPGRKRLARLSGLPYCANFERPAADVKLHYTADELEEQVLCDDVERLPAPLLPVLYAPSDRVMALSGHPNRASYTDVLRLSLEELERMAVIVDQARALGIAVGVPEGLYHRKEVRRG
ncbi:MAG: hypothetical protein ACRYFX_29240 [Janthinobacterium lividum]